MMHMSFLTCLCCGGGITFISKHIELVATCLRGRFACLAKYSFPKFNPNNFLCFTIIPSRVHFQEVFPLIRRALVHHSMVRHNVFIFHANLAKLTLEGRLIANWVVRPFIIKMCFHYKLFVLIFKIQGRTCSPILLHVAFIDFSLMRWTSKYLDMNVP